MVNAEDSHVGPAPCAALFDGLCGRVDNAEKGNRSGSDPLRFFHITSLWTEKAEIEACAASLFVDKGRVFDCLKYRIHGICDGEYETGA